MAYTDQYDLAQDATFRKRISVAMLTAAVTIQGEAIGGLSVTEYQKRQALAKKVINSTASMVPIFTGVIVTNAATTAASSDANLLTAVQTMWDDIAGIDIQD